MLVRRGEGMMRGSPALALFVPLEHGKIGDPKEAKVFGGIARLLESTVPVGISLSQRKTQQTCGGVHGVVVLLDLGLHTPFGFVLRRLAVASYNHDQVVSFSSGLFANLGRGFREILFQPLEVLE